jgi:hypothetical protein
MTRIPPAATPASHRKHNFIAILISLAAVGILYLNFEPAPAGAEPSEVSIDISQLGASSPTLVAATLPLPATAAGGSLEDDSLDSPPSPAEIAHDRAQSRMALLMNMLLLEKGHRKLSSVSSYTSTFFKQEQVGGAMGGGQVMQVKIRHEPFSVYMKWLVGDKGRELLYVDGQHDGKMLVKVGGIKGRLLPCVKLDPDGAMAMREARHPVTDIGLLNLSRKIIQYRQHEAENDYADIRCQMIDSEEIDGRPCYCFVLHYQNPETSETYRKSVQYIDKELWLPICIKNYAWPADESETDPVKLDEATIIEHYGYSNIQMDTQLADADFDRKNRRYRFRR